jgi:hypothetical protein
MPYDSACEAHQVGVDITEIDICSL